MVSLASTDEEQGNKDKGSKFIDQPKKAAMLKQRFSDGSLLFWHVGHLAVAGALVGGGGLPTVHQQKSPPSPLMVFSCLLLHLLFVLVLFDEYLT